MYDAIHYKANSPARVFDSTSRKTAERAALSKHTASRSIPALMADGTVFAGISPDTGRPMYVTPSDAPLPLTWKQAMLYAASLDVHGHKDWRVPSRRELNQLFRGRAAIGNFNTSESDFAGWYWSSSTYYDFNAWAQRFRDGSRNLLNAEVSARASLRCVRG